MSDEVLLSRLTAVHTGMNANPAYPNPPVDMKTFKSDIDSFSASIVESRDGSKKALAEKRKKRTALMEKFRLLGRFVEIMCKNDMATFLSSGFEAASTTRNPAQELPRASIRRVDPGKSGETRVIIEPLRGARNYDVRFAPAPAPGPTATWTIVTFPSAKKAAVINGLTPGTTYVFQVRAYGKLGHTDWSDSATRVCA